MNILDKRGLTLIEVLVTALLSTVVFAGIYSTFLTGNRAWAYYNDSVAVKKEARRAIFGMVNELREAENVRVIKSQDGTALHFFTETGGPVSYYWSRKGDDANRIVRRGRVNSRILAQHITGLSFYNLKNALVVDITAGKEKANGESATISLRGKIAFRGQTEYFN
jgi:prepilin-type N-terminal cleavage/methylation domain-containing protein